MPRSTSFANEHTIGYFMIPLLLAELQTKFRTVTPVYYMATREGSRQAQKAFTSAPFKLIAMYARRPKLNDKSPGMIEMKVNQIAFDRSDYLRHQGISTIIGVPVAQNITEVHEKLNMRWFVLLGGGLETRIQIPKDEGVAVSYGSVVATDLRAFSESLKFSKVFDSWEEASGILRSGPGFHAFYGYSYKPVYFILDL
jgi:hypothetical protein